MTVFKSSNISVEIRNGKVDIGDVGVKFYTQDINTTLLNIRVLKDEQFLNFNDEQYKPFINLFMGDGSVFLDQPVEISDAENGLLTYKLADKVKHAGWVKFKLILKKEDESLHAANFKLEILDSGLESEIGRVIDVDILMNAFERFALKYPERVRGKAFTFDDFTEEQLALLKGPKGDVGPKGEPGADGKDGVIGKSAYEIAVANGFKGSEKEWVTSLKDEFMPKESVKTKVELPSNASKNELRLVVDENKQYVFNGTKWIEFGSVKLDGLAEIDSKLKTSKDRMMDIEKNSNRSVIAPSGRKFPMITFIDDDGNVKVLEKWEPVLKEKKNKLTIAVVSSWVDNQEPTVMDWNTLHRLNREYGVEMVSHTHEHKHAQQLTDEEVEKEFREAQKVLKREGFTHNVIVQPFGENTKSVRTISRDYARANIATKEGINTLPLDTFRLNRVSLGESVNNTWEYYKSRLDEAIESNGWIIFKSHSQYESFNQEQIELIKKIIDYSREKKMMEVTVEEALNRIGNLIDVGDYTDKAGTSEYFVLDAEGKLHSRTLSKDYYTLKFNSSNIDTPVTSFPAQATSITPIISTNAAPFPTGKPGMLITVSSIEPSTSYQEYVPSNSETLYRRRWDKVNNKWLPFIKIIDGMVEEVARHYAKQIIVPANSTIETVITNAQLDLLNFNVGHMLQATPEKLLPDGIIFNAYILEANKITIRYANVTSAPVTVPASFFKFRISK